MAKRDRTGSVATRYRAVGGGGYLAWQQREATSERTRRTLISDAYDAYITASAADKAAKRVSILGSYPEMQPILDGYDLIGQQLAQHPQKTQLLDCVAINTRIAILSGNVGQVNIDQMVYADYPQCPEAGH